MRPMPQPISSSPQGLRIAVAAQQIEIVPHQGLDLAGALGEEPFVALRALVRVDVPLGIVTGSLVPVGLHLRRELVEDLSSSSRRPSSGRRDARLAEMLLVPTSQELKRPARVVAEQLELAPQLGRLAMQQPRLDGFQGGFTFCSSVRVRAVNEGSLRRSRVVRPLGPRRQLRFERAQAIAERLSFVAALARLS